MRRSVLVKSGIHNSGIEEHRQTSFFDAAKNFLEETMSTPMSAGFLVRAFEGRALP
jgi:hypothetical protein